MIKRTAPDFLKKIVYVLVTPFAILLALLLSDYVFGTNIYSEENNLMVYYVYSMVMVFFGMVLRSCIRIYEDTADLYDGLWILLLLIVLGFINSEWDNLW